MRLLATAAIAAAGARAAPCDLTVPGYWQRNASHLFWFEWTNPPSTVGVQSIVKDGGWNSGVITFTKADNSTVSVKYDTGHTETGAMAPNCSVVSWSDGSAWSWSTDLQTPIDIHIVPHVSGAVAGVVGAGARMGRGCDGP
jgi:hypothetical protein